MIHDRFTGTLMMIYHFILSFLFLAGNLHFDLVSASGFWVGMKGEQSALGAFWKIDDGRRISYPPTSITLAASYPFIPCFSHTPLLEPHHSRSLDTHTLAQTFIVVLLAHGFWVTALDPTGLHLLCYLAVGFWPGYLGWAFGG
jgi:hypothetical protein